MKSLNWFKYIINDLPENYFFSPYALEHALQTMDYDGRCLYINSYIDFVISWYLLKMVSKAKNDYEWLGLEIYIVSLYQDEWHRNHVRFVQYVFWKSRHRKYVDVGTLYVDPTYEGNATDDAWDAIRVSEEDESCPYTQPVLDDGLYFPVNGSAK